MKSKNLNDVFLQELRDLYDAEKQLVKALPKVAKAVSSEELQEAIEDHLAQTREHVTRLEQVFEEIGATAKGITCKAMQGLIKEADDAIADNEEGCVLDAALIACAQKVEHYEIAGYGSLQAFAEQLGKKKVAALLHTTLGEEKAANDKLTSLATSGINAEAAEMVGAQR